MPFRLPAFALVLAFAACLMTPHAAAQSANSFSCEAYDRLLREHVDAAGLVDYRGLQSDRAVLDAFVASLGGVDPAAFEQWDRADRLAFWINAYNAITLVRILDELPADGAASDDSAGPLKSIRQIHGVWTTLTTRVLGRDMTLDQIEHEVLRKEFNEPRIHAAIVCAAKGCPPLRPESLRADTLDNQLDDQVARFLGASHRFRIDREKNVVYLSPILKWFAEDFVAKYGHLGPIRGHNANDSAALHFAKRCVSAGDAAYIDSAEYRVVYLNYDWSLNEQP